MFHTMFRAGRIVPVASLLFSTVVAAEAIPESPVVVTATRTAQSADASLASVSVITRDDIERSGARDVMELLRLQNGVDVVRGGGPGQQTSVFLRGTNSNHVLVLIDGVRAASATTGAFAWTHLSTAQIERIEIVRGPRASLYGSEAIGGVIQIFTRQPDTWGLTAEAGSFDTQNLGASLAVGDERRFAVNVENRRSDGFSSQNVDGFSFNPDDDGYDNSSITAGMVYPIGDDLTFEFSAWNSNGETEFDDGVIDSLNQTFSLAAHTQSTDTWSHTLRFGKIEDEIDTQSAFPSETDTDRRMVEWQNDITVGDASLLTLGLSYIRDKARNFDNASAALVYDRIVTSRAVFAGWQSMFGKSDYQFSARLDDHENFGNESTGSIAWGRAITDALRLLASYGTAFRSPTINELYHPGYGGFFAGNPDLKPETSQTVEIGARFALTPASQLALDLFRTDVDDLIVFQGTNSQAVNLAEATIDGVELSHELTAHAWRFRTGATWQQARDGTTDAPLVRRPDRKLALNVTRDFSARTHAGVELIAASRRTDIANTTLTGYGLLNLRAAHRISDALELSARVENLLDKEYELARGFNTAARSGFVELSYRGQ